MAKNNSKNNGSYIPLIVILGIICLIMYINKCVNTSSDVPHSSPTKPKQEYSTSYNSDVPTAASSVEKELSEEDKEYLYNSLETGATPYEEAYGANYVCHRSQCSGIKVTAPRESDIVVIIKKDNSAGKVVQHGYIKAGDTYQFDVPDGTYQTFFYYGKGWNPNKPMKDGVRGGFVTDELFSKDDKPKKVYSAVLSYVLQLQKSGNFQTKGSNVFEAL